MNSHGENTPKLESKPSRAQAAKDQDQEEPKKLAEELEHEIEEIRDNLGGLVSELDHRRHRLNPLNAVGRYPWPFAVGGVVMIGLVLGGIAWHSARARERDRLVNRGKRLRDALKRAVEKPEKVAEPPPNLGMKILTAAGTAAAAVAARRLTTRMLARDS